MSKLLWPGLPGVISKRFDEMTRAYHFGDKSKEIAVTPSCGCVYCDLNCCTPERHINIA